MGNFQLRFMVTVTILHSVLVQCPLLLCFYENNQAALSCKLFSAIWPVLRDDNLIQLIGFGFVFSIVELLRSLVFALHAFWVWLWIITGSFSVCIFVFIFRRILSGNVIVRATGWPGSKCHWREIRLYHIVSTFPISHARINRASSL